MVKGTTGTGFKFKVNEKMLQNVEFLEDFYKVQHGDGLGVFPILDKLLGEEQKKALYDHIRDKDGIVNVEDLTHQLEDIFSALTEATETKN